MDSTPDRFATERSVYADRRSHLLDNGYEGKWVAIHGTEIIGPYVEYGQGWRAGIDTFHGPVFRMKRVVRQERPIIIMNAMVHRHPKV